MHGGTVILTTSNTKLMVDNSPALLESDVHTIVGCSFFMGTKYSPCVRLEWSGGAAKATSSETKVLVRSSIGKCYSGEGATQGVAIVAMTQMKTTAT